MKTIISVIYLLSTALCFALQTDLWGPATTDKTFTNAIRKIEDNFNEHESDISAAQNNINNLADSVSDNSQAIDVLIDDVNDNFNSIAENEGLIDALPTQSENDSRYIREDIAGDVTTDNIATGNVTSQKLSAAVWTQINASGGGGGLTQAEADDRYVELTGDTMTGDLLFSGNRTIRPLSKSSGTIYDLKITAGDSIYPYSMLPGGTLILGGGYGNLGGFGNVIITQSVMNTPDSVVTKSYVDSVDTANRNELYATNNAMKVYVDSADDLKLNLSGGTMSGSINMLNNNINNIGSINFIDAINYIDYIDNIDSINNIDYIHSIDSIDYISSDISLLSHKLIDLTPGIASGDSVNVGQLTSATNTCLQKSGVEILWLTSQTARTNTCIFFESPYFFKQTIYYTNATVTVTNQIKTQMLP